MSALYEEVRQLVADNQKAVKTYKTQHDGHVPGAYCPADGSQLAVRIVFEDTSSHHNSYATFRPDGAGVCSGGSFRAFGKSWAIEFSAYGVTGECVAVLRRMTHDIGSAETVICPAPRDVSRQTQSRVVRGHARNMSTLAILAKDVRCQWPPDR